MEILGGPMFAVAGSGESHGPAVSTIVFGCPPGLELSRERIQFFLDQRRPGSTKYGTTRREEDRLILLSGIFSEDETGLCSGPELSMTLDGRARSTRTYEEGWTTGEPIGALVLSTSRKTGDYAQLSGSRGEVRPGHTDLVKYFKSRGFADPRGGGRSSYRSTISDVIGGSIARMYLQHFFRTEFFSSICQVGPLKATRSLSTWLADLRQSSGTDRVSRDSIEEIRKMLAENELQTVDAGFARRAAESIQQARVEGDSLGAMVEVIAVNVPSLLGEPLYNSLKVRLMGTLGGLHAVQSCEIGDGLQVVERKGSENNDPIRRAGYQKNSHGGLIGGVTTGMPLTARVGFKPTSSILKRQLSVRKNLEEIDFQLRKGRHDPCVGVRAGITLESRMAIELMNALLWQQAANVEPSHFRIFE